MWHTGYTRRIMLYMREFVLHQQFHTRSSKIRVPQTRLEVKWAERDKSITVNKIPHIYKKE